MSPTQYISRQSNNVQRSIAVSLLMLLVAAIGVGAWKGLPWLIQIQTQWRLATRAELATLRGWSASGSGLGKQQTQLEQASIWKQFYVANQYTSVRDVVQQEVNTLLAAVGGDGLVIQPLEPAYVDGLTVSGVRATVSVNIDQLTSALVAIRSHSPYLRLQQIDVTAPQVNAPYENPTMLVVMEVVGFSQDALSSAQGMVR